MKSTEIFNLIYSHNNFDLYKKAIALWYLAEPHSPENHREDFVSLIKHLITAGSDIHVFVNTKSVLNELQSYYAITCFEEKHDCLPRTETLLIFGKITTPDLIKARSLSKILGISLIIDYRFENTFILHKNYGSA